MQKITNDKETWAENYVFSTLINCFLKEHTCWHQFNHIPNYDHVLADYMVTSGQRKLIRIKPGNTEFEVFCAVKYFSPTGRHVFNFPVIARNLKTDEIRNIGIADFVRFIEKINEVSDTVLMKRVMDSLSNTLTLLASSNGRIDAGAISKAAMSFIDAEQSLILGHSLHPVAKSRLGFSKEELLKYSPESAGEFRLHYFLASPAVANEKVADKKSISSQITDFLLNSNETSALAKEKLSGTSDLLIPAHPWEAVYLLENPEVQALMATGELKYLGETGPAFKATSSVRTVYHKECPYMFKFSLHVKITNSERVNLERELHRGYDISRLMQTPWGKAMEFENPDIEFITDPGFYTITSKKGELIEGFNTVIRKNIFTGEHAEDNVSLIAALSQDGIYGQKSRLTNIIETIAAKQNRSTEEVSKEWFSRYLNVSLESFVKIYNDFGLACEAHQQNVMLGMDQLGYPTKLYFRDNQGYFFRAGKSEELTEFIPDLAELSQSIIPEDYIHPKLTYYLIINNIFGLVNAFGVNGLADEHTLLDILVERLHELKENDTTGFVNYILNARDWTGKGNLLTTIQNMDEARAPIEAPAIYVDYPNTLMYKYFCKTLIKPETTSYIYNRYFADQDLQITIRPFNLHKDIPMLHSWFNQEHTKSFWKMDGPIRQLEEFYIMLMDVESSHALVGEVNGEPTFTMEPYWPMRDAVGKYYDALPDDYGAHLLIAPTDKTKKFTMHIGQAVMETIFRQPEVGKCIGEADVNMKPMHILVTRLGFKFQKVIEMPHKNANLTFCEREWYKIKFPECQIEELV